MNVVGYAITLLFYLFYRNYTNIYYSLNKTVDERYFENAQDVAVLCLL
jgi:hypothetical protein